MTNLFDGVPLAPRRGGALQVLIVARISTAHQDARSLDDQVALCKGYVASRYGGPVEVTVIQGRGSGELLDREDLARAEAAAESGRHDLVVVEDLGRICRRSRATAFCEACEDSGTRLIAINDHVDTAAAGWQMNALFATFKHESGNKDTAQRIRRSLRHRFTQGGVVQTVQYGYAKGEGSAADADLRKSEGAQAVYDAVFAMLEADASYAEVADWMNAQGVPTGEWARNGRWDCSMVGRLVRNPIVKGWRRRNERVSRRVNKTGQRKSVKAPAEERLHRVVPHLAFVEPDRYDRLIARLDAKNGHFARGRARGTADGRAGVPKKRTVWPGQHVACGVCGRPMYWGGHGQAGRLMCSGARLYACWNAATFDGGEAGPRLAAAVLAVAEGLPAFDGAFRSRAQAASVARRSARAATLVRLDLDIAQAGREVANLTDAVSRMGFSEALRVKLGEAEGRLARLAAERADLRRQPDDVPELPPVERLRALAREAVGAMAFGDPAFGRTMRRIVPRVAVLPHQPLDGGAVVLRATLTVNLAPLLGAAGESVGGLVAREVTVDLFDPPQRVAFRERVAALRAAGQTERAAAAACGLTLTAAQRAMALHRLMQSAGVTDAYRLLTAPPADGEKCRRHRHARYRFDPLVGYPRWPGASA